MWSDRDMEEHSVYDHRNTNGGGGGALYATTAAQTLPSTGRVALPTPGGLASQQSIYNGGSVYGTLTVTDPTSAAAPLTSGLNGYGLNGLNGYGPLPDIDQHSNSLPPPPPPQAALADGSSGSNYAAINPSEGHYSRLEYGGGVVSNGHAAVMAADGGVVYGVLDGGDHGACHVLDNMMATPEDFDDTGSVSVGGGGHYDVGKSHGGSHGGGLKSSSHGLMMIYADRLGLNERGCHVVAALAAVIFAFFVIIVSLAVCWPGRRQFFHLLFSYFTLNISWGKVIVL